MDHGLIDKSIDLILDGKDPEKPDLDLNASTDALAGATAAELESLLGSPDIGLEENESLRSQAIELLAGKRGPDYVSDFVDALRDKDSPVLMYVTSYEKDNAGASPIRGLLESMPYTDLESLLKSPGIQDEKNTHLKEEILEILTLRMGTNHVAELAERENLMEDSPLLLYVDGESKKASASSKPKSKAMQAKDKLKEMHCPLAEILPYHVMTFIMDPNGTFYIRMEQDEVVHLTDFDLILSEEMSGIVEEDYAYHLHGVTGMAQVQNSVIEFKVSEFHVNRTNVTMITDHPIARVVTVHMDQFIFAIMTTYAPEE